MTGGGSGIGRSIALGLGRVGVAVAVVDVAMRSAEATADLIRAGGGTAEPYEADVTSAEAVEHVVGNVRVAWGRPTVLVNSAGIFPRSRVVDMSEEEWDTVLATNLKGAFLMSRAVVPGMVREGFGRIISITSSLGSAGSPAGAHYAASKAGLDALMRSLAAEVAADGINVNNVAPGLTDTPMMRRANSGEYIENVTNASPRGRLGQPDDVVELVLFLCGDGATHITGQVYHLR